MQTYEIAPGETMGSLLGSLSLAAERDKEIMLVVPPGANPFTGPESVAELIGAMRGYDASLQVKAADADLVSLFRSAGIASGPLTTEAQDSRQKGGFLSKLKEMIAPPGVPRPTQAPASSGVQPARTPDPAVLPTGPVSQEEQATEAGLTGLDATMPEWLRDAPETPPETADRLVGHTPVSNLDVTMPAVVAESAPPVTATDWPNEQVQEQTPESIAQAVSAAGLDARTRSLLLFGMALVRLASAEATGAASAARQAGCSTEELRLVVEMAYALGGGPSRYIGQKILGG